MNVWEQAQANEAAWWGDCVNTYQEESKQRDYARHLGLEETSAGGCWPVYQLGGRSVIDVGGGPVSLLLKCVDRGHCVVLDPCPYPQWILDRYAAAGIAVVRERVEDADVRIVGGFDEAWVYNVLQHTIDPREAVRRIRTLAPVVRVFEWVEIPTDETHPSTLHADELGEWFGGGRSVFLPTFGASAFVGVFGANDG